MVRFCRVRYAGKSSSVSGLQLLPVVPSFRVVNKSRSQKTEERGTGSRPRPSLAELSPQIWRGFSDVSTSRLQNRGNKARIYMITKHKHKMSSSLVAQTTGSAVCGFSMAQGGPRTANTAVLATSNRGNKARMYMKTKDQLLECDSEAAAMELQRNGGNWRSRTPKSSGTKPECL